MIIHGRGWMAAIDRCEKDAIIRQVIRPGMYRDASARRARTPAGPMCGVGGMSEMMLERQQVVRTERGEKQ